MKKYLLILFVSILSSFVLHAQDGADDDTQRGGKLLERMQQYIQNRLNMTRAESERFSPVFLRYIVELKQTHRQFKTDVPMRQLKVAELRLRFRDQFKQILDEKRANRVFEHEKEFAIKVQEEINNRNIERRRVPVRGGARFVGPQKRF
jgi:flagellar hook-associated protein FlgK